MSEELTRPIIGIENRTAQEVFDIMVDRFRCTTAPSAHVVAAARALMARWPTDQHEGSPLKDEADALRSALTTEGTEG